MNSFIDLPKNHSPVGGWLFILVLSKRVYFFVVRAYEILLGFSGKDT
jgi:hypothetical protein